MTDILVQHDGPIATVVFNRPALRNAISLAMWTEIARVTEGLGKDESVRAIVYRGAGTVAFASGADISEFTEQRKDTESALRYNARTGAAYTTIRECSKPTVAMIFGFCMGGAMAVAMACDLRFAAEGATFGIPAPPTRRTSCTPHGRSRTARRWRWVSSNASCPRTNSSATPTTTSGRSPTMRRSRCAEPRSRSS